MDKITGGGCGLSRRCVCVQKDVGAAMASPGLALRLDEIIDKGAWTAAGPHVLSTQRVSFRGAFQMASKIALRAGSSWCSAKVGR